MLDASLFVLYACYKLRKIWFIMRATQLGCILYSISITCQISKEKKQSVVFHAHHHGTYT